MCGDHTLSRQLHIAAPVVEEDRVGSRASKVTCVVSWSPTLTQFLCESRAAQDNIITSVYGLDYHSYSETRFV